MLPVSASEEPPPETRAARRTAREAARGAARGAAGSKKTRLTRDVRPLEVASTVVLGGLLALTAFAGWIIVAATVTLAGLVVAWGWPRLLDSPSPRGTTAVVALASVGTAAAVLASDGDPYLRYVPAAVAGSVVAMFLHQLLRRDGRPRLTQSLATTAGALAVVTSGAGFIPLPDTLAGPEPLALAGAALALSALVDLWGGRERLRPWLLFLAVVVGAAVTGLIAAVTHPDRIGAAVLIGVLAAGVSHAVRRLLASLPPISVARSRVASGCASVLSTGLVVYTVSRVLIS